MSRKCNKSRLSFLYFIFPNEKRPSPFPWESDPCNLLDWPLANTTIRARFQWDISLFSRNRFRAGRAGRGLGAPQLGVWGTASSRGAAAMPWGAVPVSLPPHSPLQCCPSPVREAELSALEKAFHPGQAARTCRRGVRQINPAARKPATRSHDLWLLRGEDREE